MVLDASKKLPLYKQNAKQTSFPAQTQAERPARSARRRDLGVARNQASNGRYCVVQKQKQVKCTVPELKRERQPYRFYCGGERRICTGYRNVYRTAYKTQMRTVFESVRECCPGFSGPDCSHGENISVKLATDLKCL